MTSSAARTPFRGSLRYLCVRIENCGAEVAELDEKCFHQKELVTTLEVHMDEAMTLYKKACEERNQQRVTDVDSAKKTR